MQMAKALFLSMLPFVLTNTLPGAAHAKATCFCKISFANLDGKTQATSVCRDLTSTVNKSYTGAYQQHEDNQKDCRDRCKTATQQFVNAPPSTSGFSPPPNSQPIANACCAAGAPHNATVVTFSAVGTKAYRIAHPDPAGPQGFGLLQNQPAVTQKKCPAGWLANQTNVDGGVTADGKCKKFAGTLSVTPLPPNGTQVGSYGFTWGNGLWAWGTSSNGGEAVQTTVSAAICTF